MFSCVSCTFLYDIRFVPEMNYYVSGGMLNLIQRKLRGISNWHVSRCFTFHWRLLYVTPTTSLTRSSAFIACVFLNASGPRLPSWYARSSMAVDRGTLARSLTLPTFQVAEGFALPAVTASSSLRFTVPPLAVEHFRLLAQVWNCLPPEVTLAPSLATQHVSVY